MYLSGSRRQILGARSNVLHRKYLLGSAVGAMVCMASHDAPNAGKIKTLQMRLS